MRLCFGRASRRQRHSPICRSQEAAKRDLVRGYPSFPNSTLGAQGTSGPYRARLLNSAGFSFTLTGRGEGSRELFGCSLLGTADAPGAHNPGAPRLLDFSLKLKRNAAKTQSSAFADAPVLEALTRVID